MEEEKCPKVLPSNTVIKFAEGQHVIYNPVVTAYFRNGKRGCIVGRKEGEGDYQFRFYNVERDEDLSRLPDKITDEDFERRQILAVSFLGYWLYFQGEKKLDTIMQNFYEIDKQNYIHLARVNFGTDEKEASRDYIQRVYYERDERDSHYKERLFEYLSVDNQKIIEGVLLDYRNYLSRRLEIEYPEYMLDWINNRNQAKSWNNATSGWIHSYNSLHEYDGDYILSFQSVDWKRSDGRRQPEIAKGFVAYWIYIKDNRPTNIFESYYRFKLEKYKKEHQGDFDYSFREEKIELEFIEKHIEEEERFIALSQLHLYSYLNNGCVALIEDDVKKYREFLKLRHDLLKKIYPQPAKTPSAEEVLSIKATKEQTFKVLNLTINAGEVNLSGITPQENRKQEISEEQMKTAVKKCIDEGHFSQNVYWAVVYSVWKYYGYNNTREAFMAVVREWDFSDWCTKINKDAFRPLQEENKNYNLPPNEWESKGGVYRKHCELAERLVGYLFPKKTE